MFISFCQTFSSMHVLLDIFFILKVNLHAMWFATPSALPTVRSDALDHAPPHNRVPVFFFYFNQYGSNYLDYP